MLAIVSYLELYLPSAKENRLNESPRGIVYKPDKSEEPIALSKLPQGMQNGRVAPIERDDWPAPPDPAAAYPELCEFEVKNFCVVSNEVMHWHFIV